MIVQPLFLRLERVRVATGTSVLVFAAVVGAAAVVVATVLVADGYSFGEPWVVAGLALVSALTERARVNLGQSIEISVSLLPALFAAVLFGPLAGMIVFAASMLCEGQLPPIARGLYSGMRALTGATTGVLTAFVATGTGSGSGAIVFSSAVGAVVAEFMDIGFSSIVFALRGHGSPIRAFRQYLPLVLTSVPFYMPVVALLTLAYRELSPLTLPLFFIPALAAQRWFVLYQAQRELADELVVANGRLEKANLSFATALVATLDARDRYTAGHSAAVADHARAIAARLGLDTRQQHLAHLAGLVHDIGKIGLPAGLLEKPGALTLDERRQMEQHPVIGERILSNVDTYIEVAAAVRHHHERMDGNGYPDGLRGPEIPLLARIIAVADAFDAMTSDRPYRDAMPTRVARLRLAQAADSQFDTTVVAAFEALLAGMADDDREKIRSATAAASITPDLIAASLLQNVS